MRQFFLGIFTTIVALSGYVGYRWVEDERWINEPFSVEADSCPFESQALLDRQQLFETRHWRVLTNYRPIVDGHCMLIPKRHVTFAHDLTAAEMENFQEALVKTHELVSSRLHTGPYRLLQKNGREAGQSVPHVHYHYMPLQPGSNPVGLLLREVGAEHHSPLSEKEQLQLKRNLLGDTPLSQSLLSDTINTGIDS